MFTNRDEFIATGIGPLIAGAERLHVLFATYNNVAAYENGPVETDKDGLTIQVQNGNLEYSPTADLIYFIGTPLGEIGSQAMRSEARAAQSELESKLKIEAQKNASFLAVIYAGLSAFDEAIEMARKVKQEYVASKVVIVTCDCDFGRKHRTLDPMLASGQIDTVVETYECGGFATMRDILRATINSWPARVPVPA